SGNVVALTFTTFGLGWWMIGFSRLESAVRELHAAREEIARLAVADERVRFARDLHDLLGHSLSLIALKSELAGRLLPGRADDARAAPRGRGPGCHPRRGRRRARERRGPRRRPWRRRLVGRRRQRAGRAGRARGPGARGARGGAARRGRVPGGRLAAARGRP